MKRRTRFFLAQFVFMMFFAAGYASAQVTTATLSGTVKDGTGAVLPGVKIELTNEGTGTVRTVMTDSAGHYNAPQLAVGNYRLSASLEGFQTQVHTGIVLTVGAQAVVDVTLQVGAVTQTVEVTGEAPLVQTQESTVSYLVEDKTMRDLPLNGRDMTQLILLNPGVTLSVNSPANTAFSGYGKRVSISGMRGEDNIYLLDGGLIGDFRRHIPAGPSGALLGIETVQEFQVLTNSFGAQYGRALGGVFNAVSKSGTNEFHGNAYEYLRNSALDAARWEDNRNDLEKAPFRRNQFGATFGGPLQKEKTFFFVAYEGTRESLSQTQTLTTLGGPIRQQAIASMVPYVNQYPLPNTNRGLRPDGTGDFVYQFTQPTTEHFGQTRIDLPNLTPNDSFFVRFTGSHSDQVASGNQFPGYVQASSLGSWLVTLSETHIISPTTLNAVRFHFNRVVPLDTGDHPPAQPGVFVTPGQDAPIQLTPSGLNSIGGAGFDTDPTYMVSNRFTYQDDLNLTRGAHALQLGGFVERLQFNGSFPNRSFGVWSFTSIANFLNGIPSTFRGALPGFGTYQRGFRNWSFALYVQDNWRVTSKLNLNLGVRWEPYTVPTEVANRIANLRHIMDTEGTVGGPYWLNGSWREIGPRVGFAYTPFESGRTSVRGGFALLYEPNDPNLYYTQMVRMPPLAYDFTITVPTGQNFFPNGYAQIAAQNTLGPAYALPYDNMRSPHALQYNFNIQQQLTNNDLVSVGYTGSRGINLLSVGDINMPRAVFNGVSLEFPANAQLVNPAWSSIVLYANNTNSFYNGLLMSYQRRLAQGFQGQIAFTWSKGIAETDSGQTAGGVTTGGGRMKYPNDHHVQRGLSGYDFRRILSFNYSYDLPFGRGMSGWMGRLLSGWQTTGVLTLRDGQPLSITAAVPTALSALAVTPRSPNLMPGFSPNPSRGTTAGCTYVNGIPGPYNASAPASTSVLPNQKLGTPELYFDPCAFASAGPRELGNVGRNTLIGPGSVTWNPALFKRTGITERMSLEFRAEFFNVLNRPNFAAPSSGVFNGTGGLIGTVGTIRDTTGTPRQIQFALKLLF